MALSMDEQRILDQIERGLADADPLLAARLSSFGFQRTALRLRTRRARVLVSCVTVLVVTAMSLVVYALVPFRATPDRHATGRSSASPGQAVMSAQSHGASSSAPVPADRIAGRSAAPSTKAVLPGPPATRAQ